MPDKQNMEDNPHNVCSPLPVCTLLIFTLDWHKQSNNSLIAHTEAGTETDRREGKWQRAVLQGERIP